MLQKKEDETVRLASEVATLKRERTHLQNNVIEVHALAEKQAAELDTYKMDMDRALTAKGRLQEELDELRTLMETKSTEETRRREVEKSREDEVADLRHQLMNLQVYRKTALDNESKLRLEVERVNRQYAQLESSHASLLERERATNEQFNKAEAVAAATEKSKRTLESELNMLRAKQIDSDSRLADSEKAKEVS